MQEPSGSPLITSRGLEPGIKCPIRPTRCCMRSFILPR